MKKIYKNFIAPIIIFIFVFSPFTSISIAEAVNKDNVRKFYCGSIISASNCKCAFHGEGCDSDEQNIMNQQVMDGFYAWLAEEKARCSQKGGRWYKGDCQMPPVCNNRQLIIDWECIDIADFCGPDPKILYNLIRNQCYCPEDFELENEDGKKTCIQLLDIDLNFEIVKGELNPPLLADGLTKTIFRVSADYKKDKSPADLRFQLSGSGRSDRGVILVEGDAHSDYLVTYTTPNLSDFEGTIQPETLNIYFKKYQEETEDKLTQSIRIYTASVSKMKVIKPGFETVENTPIFFSGPTTRVKVYTMIDNKKYPVTNSKIIYDDGDKYERTNNDGFAILKSPENNEGETEEIIEVELVLKTKYSSKRQQGLDKYKNIGIVENNIYNYLYDFPKEIADEGDVDQMKQLLSGIILVPYSLFFIDQGMELAEDSSDNIGSTLGDTVSDLIELSGLVDKFASAAVGPLKKFGAKGLKITPESFKELYAEVASLPGNFVKRNWIKIRALILSKKPDLDPRILDYIYREVVKEYTEPKTLSGYVDDKIGEIEDGVKDDTNSFLDNFSIGDKVSSALDEYYKNKDKELMEKISNKVKKGDIVTDLVDINIDFAQETYTNYAQQYLDQHEREYNVTMFNEYMKLILDVGGNSAKVISGLLAPQFYEVVTKVVDGIDKSYKAINATVLNNAKLFTWLLVYSQNMDMVQNTVNDVMQLSLSQNESVNENQLAMIFEQVYAEEIDYEDFENDFFTLMYDNKVSADNLDRQVAIDYYMAKNDEQLYDSLTTITEIIAEAQPDNKEVQELKKTILNKVEKIKETIEENNEKVAGMTILNKVEKSVSDEKVSWKLKVHLSMGGMIVLGAIVWLLLIWGIISFFKGNRRRAGILVGIVILYWLSALVIDYQSPFEKLGDPESANNFLEKQGINEFDGY